MSSPIESFFSLGNKVTNGDPVRKAKFDYYLYWILAIAFFFLMINYFYSFYQSSFTRWSLLAWGFIMMVITWFNYHTLAGFYNMYLHLQKVSGLIIQNKEKDKGEELTIESVEEMVGGFKDGSN